VQLYTALAYSGLSLARRIASGLETLARQAGFARVSDATGTGRDLWL
jgi:dihydroorotate dehydrogenase